MFRGLPADFGIQVADLAGRLCQQGDIGSCEQRESRSDC